jgi:AraC family transcriptional regulator
MIQDLNRLMDYIEERLTDELSLAEAQRRLGFLNII